MKSKLLLWLLLLCSGSAWAQNLSVTESFENDVAGNSGEGSRYFSNSFALTTSRYFVRASNPVTVLNTQTFPTNVTVVDDTYFWACEGVRGSNGATPAAGSVSGTVRLASPTPRAIPTSR